MMRNLSQLCERTELVGKTAGKFRLPNADGAAQYCLNRRRKFLTHYDYDGDFCRRDFCSGRFVGRKVQRQRRSELQWLKPARLECAEGTSVVFSGYPFANEQNAKSW